MLLLTCPVILYLTLFDPQEHGIILAATVGPCSLLYLCNTSDITLYYFCDTFAGFVAMFINMSALSDKGKSEKLYKMLENLNIINVNNQIKNSH